MKGNPKHFLMGLIVPAPGEAGCLVGQIGPAPGAIVLRLPPFSLVGESGCFSPRLPRLPEMPSTADVTFLGELQGLLHGCRAWRGGGRSTVVGRMWSDKGSIGHGRMRCHGCRPPATASAVCRRSAARAQQPARPRPPSRSVAREPPGESWGRQRGVVDISRRKREGGCPSDAV